MPIKFQYNKTSLNELGKGLKMRERALPTIKSKESALRMEVKKAKAEAERLDKALEEAMRQLEGLSALFPELDTGCVEVEAIDLQMGKVAGVKVPVLKEIRFKEKPFLSFAEPAWTAQGMETLKQLASIGLQSEVFRYKMQYLEKARKKTTQKVNLYEKVQIPGYKEAIQKIKRFIEDEENLSKSSQKIVKSRHMQQEEAL
ncbi:MAG: V-type ATP synthase subunit D [Bacteroidales bacterium]|nr:V-type ATP synthase subunit D [Bacteroidales bacterium]